MPKRIRQKIESELYTNNPLDNTVNNSRLKMEIDPINLKIIEELLNNPDIKSSELASKLQIPLSTLQRRKTRLEVDVLKKFYYFDFSQIGYRMAEVFLHVENGKTDEVAKKILKMFNKNVLKISSRIDSTTNLCVEILFKDSVELHQILEGLRSMECTSNTMFSEIVNVIGNNMNEICVNILRDEFDVK